MAHSVYELNLCRRELIRPDLNDQYRQLCNSQTPISKLLFGDDLLKVVKDITESNKVSQKLSFWKDGSYSKHGWNALKRQGSYSNRQLTFFVHWPIPEDWSRPQKEGENRSVRTFKVVQSGSTENLPTVTSIPCVAGRLKNCVFNWETITSDQRILEAIRGVTIDFYECPTQVSSNLIPQNLR